MQNKNLFDFSIMNFMWNFRWCTVFLFEKYSSAIRLEKEGPYRPEITIEELKKIEAASNIKAGNGLMTVSRSMSMRFYAVLSDFRTSILHRVLYRCKGHKR